MKYFKLISIIFVFSIIFTKNIFAEERKCYIDLENKTNIEDDLIINISMSIIGKFVTKIMPSPVSGINFNKDCFYRVSLQKVGDELFLTFSGEGLKSFGSSTKSESEGFKEALVLALLRGVEDEREKICREYGKDLEDCKTIMYWMDLKIPEHRFLFNPIDKLIIQYDYLIFDNFGIGFTYANDKKLEQHFGSSDAYKYSATFLNGSFVKNVIPQVNLGVSIGLLISGESTIEASGDYRNYDGEKSQKRKLSSSSNHITIFGGYQVKSIEYIIGLQTVSYKISDNEYKFCQSFGSNVCSGKFKDWNILSPIFGIGYLF